MPFVGSIIPERLVQLGQQARRARRAKEERREDPAKSVSAKQGDAAQITAPDAVAASFKLQKNAGNETEQAREDHEAALVGGAYERHGPYAARAERPRDEGEPGPERSEPDDGSKACGGAVGGPSDAGSGPGRIDIVA